MSPKFTPHSHENKLRLRTFSSHAVDNFDNILVSSMSPSKDSSILQSVLFTPFPPSSTFVSSTASTSKLAPQPFELLTTPTSGRSLFASTSILPKTILLTSDEPVARTVLAPYLKEVCWECFRETVGGKKWTVREVDIPSVPLESEEILEFFIDLKIGGEGGKKEISGKKSRAAKGKKGKRPNDPGGVRWFCSAGCRSKWREKVGHLGREAARIGEDVIRRAVAKRDTSRKAAILLAVSLGDDNCLKDTSARVFRGETASMEEIEEAWRVAWVKAEVVNDLRNRGQKRALVAMSSELQEDDDEDVFRFLLDGIVTRFNKSGLEDSSTGVTSRIEKEWTSLRSLVPTLSIYTTSPTGARALRSHIRMYLALTMNLPIELLEYVTPESVLVLLTRDCGNSFGIWEENIGGEALIKISNPALVEGNDTSLARGNLLAYALYPSLSYFNHSCTPTVTKTRKGSSWIFATISSKIIEAGEELCISYLGGEEVGMERKERREKLKEWGFDCACRRCEEEE